MIKTLKKFLAFAGEENKKKIVLSIWLGLIEALANALKIPAIMIILYGFGNNKNIITYIIASLALMLFSIALTIFAKVYICILETEGGYNACAFKRIEIAKHLRYLPMGYFNKKTLGSISSVVTNTLDGLSGIATRVLLICSQGVLETLLVILCLCFFDIRIGLIALVGFSLFMLINQWTQRSGESASEEKAKSDQELVGSIVEYLQGNAEMRSYGLYGDYAISFDKANQACADANTSMELKYQPGFFLQGFVIRLTGIAMCMASLYFYLAGSMNALVCIGMIISAFILFSGLEIFGNFSALLHICNKYMDQVDAILTLPVMDAQGSDITVDNYEINYENITFSYDQRKIIDNLSLIIPEHKTTAIVGPSGSGKTTLCRLAARFFDVDAGKIELGNKNLKDYHLDSLMNNYTFVFQDVYLFNDTIENNIKFAKPEASHEEVERAAKMACCEEFIAKLPQGYNTMIGENGHNLSGGERQRLSIARAIIKDAPIVILDEATANVDPENEEKLMQAFSALTHNKTIIMIAHRLKTVETADEIVVLDKGQIVAKGTHQELLSKDGLYKQFVEARRYALNWRIHS